MLAMANGGWSNKGNDKGGDNNTFNNSRTQQIKKFNKGFINYTKSNSSRESSIKYIRTVIDGNKKYLTRDDIYNFVGNVEMGLDFQGITVLMIGTMDKGKFFPAGSNSSNTTPASTSTNPSTPPSQREEQ